MGNESLMLCREEAPLPWLSPLALLRRKPGNTKIFTSHSLIQRSEKTKSDKFWQLGQQPEPHSRFHVEFCESIGTVDFIIKLKLCSLTFCYWLNAPIMTLIIECFVRKSNLSRVSRLWHFMEIQHPPFPHIKPCKCKWLLLILGPVPLNRRSEGVAQTAARRVTLSKNSWVLPPSQNAA